MVVRFKILEPALKFKLNYVVDGNLLHLVAHFPIFIT